MTNPETIVEAVKATPPAAVLGMTLFGYSLGEVTAVLAFALICLQIFFLLKEKVYDKWKNKKTKE